MTEKWADLVLGTIRIRVVVEVVVVFIVSSTTVSSSILRHWREGNTFWKIWKWINESSLLLVVVVE